MSGYPSLFAFPPRAGVDPGYLDGVKRSFADSGIGGDLDRIILVILVLVGLILLLVLLRIIFRPAKYRPAPSRVDEIVAPAKVRDTIDRSVTLRAVYDVEIFDDAYQEIYKGPVLGVSGEGRIEVELTSYSDPNLDFRDKQARVNFRMSRRGKAEFYQFDTSTEYLGVTDAYGRREKVLRLVMPEMIEKGQKRRHLRVRPTGRYAFDVDVLQPVLPANPIPIRGFRRIHEAKLSDVSIGGMQVIVQGRLSEIRVLPGDEIFLHFLLPEGELHLEGAARNIFAKAEVVSIARESSGRRVMSREADENLVGPNRIRLKFTGRGILNERGKNVSFRAATTLAFEDLSRWVQAYQRYRIQVEKGLLPQPSKTGSIYTSHPLKVEPKYPPTPLRKK